MLFISGPVVGMPPKRLTRSMQASKKAITFPSQLPSKLLTTLAPTPLVFPLPLPLKQPIPIPSDVDVDMLVGVVSMHWLIVLNTSWYVHHSTN